MKFRLLRAEEIEARIAQTGNNWVKLLLYKDARCDMNILDETFGPMGWQRSHEVINGNLFCNVSVYDENTKQWITKQDVGTESYTEKEKGQASDSFKRACFNWGIGRELYTAPVIFVKSTDVDTDKKLKYIVDEIQYSPDRKIKYLVIKDSKGEIRFTYGTRAGI